MHQLRRALDHVRRHPPFAAAGSPAGPGEAESRPGAFAQQRTVTGHYRGEDAQLRGAIGTGGVNLLVQTAQSLVSLFIRHPLNLTISTREKLRFEIVVANNS